jgi:hypothetical protein
MWVVAWLLAWLARRPDAPYWMRRVPVPLAVCALFVGLAAIEIETRVAGTGLAVVRHATALSSDPALGMDRGPSVATGEIVRIAGRRGAWTRVQASDERDGWIGSSQLLLVSDRRPPSP